MVLHGAYEAAMELAQDLAKLLHPGVEKQGLLFLTDKVMAIESSPSITGALPLLKALLSSNTIPAAFQMLEYKTGNTSLY